MPGVASLGRAAGTGLAALVSAPALAEGMPSAVTIDASYTSDSFANVRGGLERGFSQMGLLELSMEVDGSAFGLEGSQVHAAAQWVHGRSLSGRFSGDGQVASNIDAPDGVRPFEAWISVPVAAGGYLKAGLIDLNAEFDVQQVGGFFLNSSHGVGPDFSQSGLNGPSIFPTTSTGVVGGWSTGGWSLRLGLFDAVAGDPDRPRRTVVRFPGETGLLLAGEADRELGDSALLRIGGWTYTTRFEPLGAGPGEARPARGRSRGGYVMLESGLGEVDGQAMRGWLRAGIANARVNPVALYLGGGIFLGRGERGFGIAVAHAVLGDSARREGEGAPLRRAETNVEITYAWPLTGRIAIQPNLQYVRNPGWDPDATDALILGTRLRLSLF